MLTAVREGQKGPLICPECSCRLNVVSLDKETVFAHHFSHDYDSTRDARGHICSNIGRVWTVDSKKVEHLID